VFVLPDLAVSQPGYVNDILAVATSSTPVGDVSQFQTLSNVGITYIAGGAIFGIALVRAGILARWAAALMSVGAVATIATFQLPELTQRLFAIPAAVALIGLGYSLWREQRTHAVRVPPGTGSSQFDPAGAR
jgi:Mn2+/Fe2+ NRAMP family transporter